MWVDITSLIKETGVGQFIDIQLLPSTTNTGDYGVADDDDGELLEKVFCAMVENVDRVVDSQSGSYISRVTYDFYIPYQYSIGRDLEGAKIKDSYGKNYTVTHRPINQKYVSHCVITATEDKLTHDYGGGY